MSPESLRILFYAQGHPELRAGGSEVYAHELFTALRQRRDCKAYLFARAGPPYTAHRRPHDGAILGMLDPADAHQYLVYQDDPGYDHFHGESPLRRTWHEHLARFLHDLQPDVVHLHQVAFFGYSGLRRIRQTLPHAVIVMTLHDFGPICARDGQMLRTDGQRCTRATLLRCHECLPTHPASAFLLRQHAIQAHLEHVDVFHAPSRFLLERFADWGLPREKLHLAPYGRILPSTPPAIDGAPSPRQRFAFFGQFTPYKGLRHLLRAWIALRATTPEPAGELVIHGNNLALQTAAFRAELAELIARAGPTVRLTGEYRPADLPRLMEQTDWVVVPSVWWENSPLVIQEAFAYGRPVICGDVGGMAEAVRHEVNGLHFATGDENALAATLHRACSSPGLWDQLRANVPAVPDAHAQASEMLALYRQLLSRRHVSV